MKNKKLIFILFFFIFLNGTTLNSKEEFAFEVTEIEILNEGNFFRGLKRGNATTIDGNITITADTFEYDKIKNVLKAKGDVVLKDKIKNYLIESNDITYFKNNEKIFSKDKTRGFFENKYEVFSSDIKLDNITNIINTDKKTRIIDDNFTEYETDLFHYSIDDKIFKGKNIKIITGTNKVNIDKEFYNFKEGIFDLENKEFVASDTKIFLKKSSFDVTTNDPRIYGNSSKRIGNITKINKAIFTSCELSDDCPPWSIKANTITHDQIKKDIIYENPILKLYDYPIFYFPRFSHADPSVRRRSGILQPQFNNSNILGSSLYLPYFNVLSENKDLTLKPTIFDTGIYMLQNEYRQTTENSNLVANIGLTKGYKPENESQNSIVNLFAKFTSELNLNNFTNSKLNFSIQKTTKDTFLKVFDTNLMDMNKNIKPKDQNELSSDINLSLEHEKFYFDTGAIIYENLNGNNSDRYQYILPFYNFSSNIYQNSLLNLEFSSNGSNSLKETNKVESKINNNFVINSRDFFSKQGFKNNFKIFFKNLNKVGKNANNFKSSPQIELANIINLETSLPLLKITEKYTNIITPKLSLRINPGDMNNASKEDRIINVNNIFDINRLGLSETLENGKSLTLGIDYKKESVKNINQYFEFKLAGVIRDVKNDYIPVNSSLNQKSSNLFGSLDYSLSKNINLDYDFSLDNDLNTFENNSINLELNFDKVVSNFKFMENSGKIGSSNIFENSTLINLNDDNFLTFSTRRNRKINFTEYYDLVYEYKNDCMIAGVKYKKSYYQDRDLKPSEDLLFTITFFPISTYEQKIDESVLN